MLSVLPYQFKPKYKTSFFESAGKVELLSQWRKQRIFNIFFFWYFQHFNNTNQTLLRPQLQLQC